MKKSLPFQLLALLGWCFILTGAVEANAQSGLFKYVNEVKVTPFDSIEAGLFVRIGYVPGRNKIVVTFKARHYNIFNNCIGHNMYSSKYSYGYREYTTDMVATDKKGIFSCMTGPDIGGGFFGDSYYGVAMGRNNNTNRDGWLLAKFNAVTWEVKVPPFFFPLDSTELTDDPMIANVNGLIDVSSHYKYPKEIGPGHHTHHQFFTPDLQFVNKRVFSDTSHINLTSLLVIDNIINFVTSTDLWGNMIVMQYTANWNYLGWKLLKKKSSAPEGIAFDGKRFYVSYLDVPCEGLANCYMNVRLAAFDKSWNIIDDIAVTNFTPNDHKQPGRPSLTLWNNRIYVCYDQNENETFDPTSTVETTDVQAYVKAYDISDTVNSAPDAIWNQKLAFSINQNYPNPLSTFTNFDYTLHKRGKVKLQIIDNYGQHINTLVHTILDAGKYHAFWNGKSSAGETVPNGTYCYLLSVDGVMITKKMILVK